MRTERQICPWCDTEIVYDPEVGPEKICPNCSNELGDYRTIKLSDLVRDDEPDDEPVDDDEDFDDDNEPGDGDGVDGDFDDFADEDDFNEAEYDELERYDEAVRLCRERQDEVPECVACREDMLFAGEHEGPAGFRPFVPEPLGEPILVERYSLRVYVCPSCYRVVYTLSEDDRMRMIETLKRERNLGD
jgi:hypothetical protein